MAAGALPLAEPTPSRGRRAALWLAGLLSALLLAAAWFGPGLLQWEHYRGRIAEVAGIRLGRSVTIEGPITLALLPEPRIEAGAVAIGAAEDGVSVTARTLRLRLALGALLQGRLEPREVILLGGDIALPWPPHAVPGFRPPLWLSTLDARVEESRVQIGGLLLEGLNARLVAAGTVEAIRAEGRATYRGRPLQFNAQLGRAGFDGVAPLDIGLAIAGATVSAVGLLTPADGFEGKLEAAGPDLSALLPAPARPFRAAGRLIATGDLFASDGLSLDLGNEAARGAVTLRVAPEARLDLTLSAVRLDLEAWIAAIQAARGGAAARPVPLGIDLAVEVTSLGGVPLRRLRGTALLEGERLALSGVVATLPGETQVELSGTTSGEALDLAVHARSATPREVLAALGALPNGLDPARLRQAEARFRLRLTEGDSTVSELVGMLDGTRVVGGGSWRGGTRPRLGIGLTFDRLELDGLAEALPELRTLAAATGGLDLNLRLATERMAFAGLETERGGLDLSLEAGRLVLRRLDFRLGEVNLVGMGTAQLGSAPRLQDGTLEVQGSSGTALAALLPPGHPLRALLVDRVALRISGSGTIEALATTIEGELGDLRLESAGTLDLEALRGTGTVTLRHPGAPRLLAPWLGDSAGRWLGQGSFSVVSALSGSAADITAEHLDLVAGGLRGRGQMTLALDAVRPRLRGRFVADTLPLPALVLRDQALLPFATLGQLDAELALEAGMVEWRGLAPLEQATATLKLADGTLRLEALEARLGGGALRASLIAEGTTTPPRVALEATLEAATLTGPLSGLPLDLSAGQIDASAKLHSAGFSLSALLGELGGEARVELRDGVLVGFDLAALLAAAALPEPPAIEAALRQAVAGGATAFERLQGKADLSAGRARLGEVALAAEGGATATASGSFDLGRGTVDLRIATKPQMEAPEIALRFGGPLTAPRRSLELGPFLRWRATRKE